MQTLRKFLLLCFAAFLLLTGCVKTIVPGTNNEAYRTEAPDTEWTKPRTEAADGKKFVNPTDGESVPAYYAKIRLPGIEPLVYAFTDSTGEQCFRVFAEDIVSGRTGFLKADIHADPKRPGRFRLQTEGEFLQTSSDNPGKPVPKKEEDASRDKPIRDHWLPVRGENSLYSFRAKSALFQYRRWASIGNHEGFYPSNDVGILLLGGIPDAVRIDGKWVDVRILNPMMFAGRANEAPITEIIIQEPDEPDWTPSPPVWTPRPEPDETEPPDTEEPDTTEPPITESPVTEDPVTEDPVTEDPVTEDPGETEPSVTEEPSGEPQEEENTEEAMANSEFPSSSEPSEVE